MGMMAVCDINGDVDGGISDEWYWCVVPWTFIDFSLRNLIVHGLAGDGFLVDWWCSIAVYCFVIWLTWLLIDCWIFTEEVSSEAMA